MKKNKILKKIILVVLSVSVLVSAFIIPSFAYSYVENYKPPSLSVNLRDNKYVPTQVIYPDAEMLLTGNQFTYSYNQHNPAQGDYGTLFYNLVNSKTVDYTVPGDDDFQPVLKEFYIYADKDVSGNFNNGFNFGKIEFALKQPFILRQFNIPYSSIFLCLPNANLGDSYSYTVAIRFITPSGEARLKIIDLNTTVVRDDLDNKGIYLYYLFNNITDYVPMGSLITDITMNPPRTDDFTALFNDSYTFNNVYGDLVSQRGVKFIFRYDSSLYSGITGFRDYVDELQDISYNEGYSVGNGDGYEDGYSVGYEEGFTYGSINANMSSPFDFILSSVTTFLAWEFIPGVSFALLASVFVGSILMIILLKKLAGG